MLGLAIAFLVGAKPAHACLNEQAWPSGIVEKTGGLRVSFGEVNDPPQYCYEWKVRYTNVYWLNGDGCKDMSDNSFTLDWETLQAHSDSSMSNPGDTGNFEIRARSSVPKCGYVGTWSDWKAYTFTVPDSDSD